jgi:hypothetical protein
LICHLAHSWRPRSIGSPRSRRVTFDGMLARPNDIAASPDSPTYRRQATSAAAPPAVDGLPGAAAIAPDGSPSWSSDQISQPILGLESRPFRRLSQLTRCPTGLLSPSQSTRRASRPAGRTFILVVLYLNSVLFNNHTRLDRNINLHLFEDRPLFFL